jgi:NAD(P)-dependent dehydrogenase (short-subunit alcohol dehydrogenase family)
MSLPISRTVLITGAARRIGRALALDLAAHGWRVAVHFQQSAEAAAEVVQQIRQSGGEASAFRADLSNLEEARALTQRCVSELGPLDCLINNASLYAEDTLATLNESTWGRHMDINLRAPVFLTQDFAAALPPGRQGNVINIIDQRVLRPRPLFFSYAASKAGLWAVTRTMAQALAPHIRVNAIGPGPTLPSIYQSDEQFAMERSETLLKDGAAPGDIAAAARFILEAKAMTGQMIALDGGQHLSWRT